MTTILIIVLVLVLLGGGGGYYGYRSYGGAGLGGALGLVPWCCWSSGWRAGCRSAPETRRPAAKLVMGPGAGPIVAPARRRRPS